ncbi:MAG: hypothetical protein WDZ45_07150 [Flavobacteriaceae bacterium]
MKTNFFNITTSVFCAILSISCVFSEKNTSNEIHKVDTLKQSSDSSLRKELSENENKKNLIKVILKDKQPLNQQELLDIFPFRIQEYSSENVKVVPGIAMVTGNFGNSIKLTIQDFAGTEASAISYFIETYDMNLGSKIIYKEREHIKTKSIYQNENSEIIFVYLNRFMITLEGKKMTPDQLWELFDVGILSSLKVLDQYNNRNH